MWPCCTTRLGMRLGARAAAPVAWPDQGLTAQGPRTCRNAVRSHAPGLRARAVCRPPADRPAVSQGAAYGPRDERATRSTRQPPTEVESITKAIFTWTL